MSWLWAILGLPILGVLATVAYDVASGRRAERREQRREGAAVMTPVTELLKRSVGPEATVFGSREQIHAMLDGVHKRWWDDLRPPLLEYANQHPSERVLRLTVEFATDFSNALASTRYFYSSLDWSETMEPYETAQRRKQEAVSNAEELIAEIRKPFRRWVPPPLWLSRRRRRGRQLAA